MRKEEDKEEEINKKNEKNTQENQDIESELIDLREWI